MSKSRRVWILATVIFSVFVIGSFVFGKRAFSYDTHIAHPSIVTIAGLEYNKIYDPDLTLEEIGWLADGAVEEDMPTRWLNHFYDPVYNQGLDNGKYPSSKDWSKMTNFQTTFALGDQTWYRAIDYWQKSDKKKALKALGHILHLIADASVPAHTRDDAHPTGDSYEQFVKNNWLNLGKFAVGFEKEQVNNLDEAFDAMANYSNNNFYSDDTIESKKYNRPTIINYIEVETPDGFELYGVNNNNVRLFVKSSDKKGWNVSLDVKNKNKKIVPYLNTVVLTDYSKNILPKATGYTIATINLFFQEVQKEQNVKLAKYKNSLVGAADYLLGTVINKVEDLFNMFKGKDESLVMAGENDDRIQNADNKIQTVAMVDDKTQNTLNIIQIDDAIQDTSNKIQINNKIQNTISKTQTTAAAVEEPVVEEAVKWEETKSVVKTVTPMPQQVWYLGGPSAGSGQAPSAGSGQGGGGGGETENTPPAPLREGSLPTIESSIPYESLTIPSSEEGAGGVGDGITTITTTTEQTTTTTLDVVDVIITATSTIFTTSTLEQTTTSTEQIVTTTVEIVIATSTPEEAATSTLPIVETPPPPTVVINEIAWAGTASSKANDEWVELYSNATSTIDLTGWKILVGDKEIKLSGAISVGGYYLLERTKDKTVTDITADNIFTLAGGLNNSGARLRLINNIGDVVDEVDSSAGWFAGDSIKYRSMARKSATASGNDPNNWFSSQGLPAKGKVDGGGVIYGSPKFSNYGYWMLNAPTFYYSNLIGADKVLTLTKANSPYIIDYQTDIPAGYTLKIEPGVVLIGLDRTSYLSVAGKLIVDGTVEAPVVFTSALDTNYVQTNLTSLSGPAAPGDWSRIKVEPGGSFIGSFVKFLYGGQALKRNPGSTLPPYLYSNIILNYGGSVNLNNAEFLFNYFDSSVNNEQYSALIYVEAPNGYDASLTVNNSNFNGGWRAIKIFRQGNSQTITTNLAGNTFQNFQNPNQLIKSARDFVSLSDSIFVNNVSDNISLDSWTLTQDYTLDSTAQYLFNNISVPIGVTLNIDPGVKIKLAEYGAIEAEGSIQANGTAEQPIIFEIQTPGEKWGYVKLKNSNSTFNYTDFIGGNRTLQGDPNDRAVLMAENSTVNLNNINILDTRAPGNVIYSLNSNLNITDSVIGNAVEPDFDMTGIKTDSGSVILDNVILQNLKFGIRGDFNSEGLLPHLELNNMPAENFINVERPWDPNTWFSPSE
ncbi:MAG: lamin tail domain-containing protein [Candidatus Magasanikbacteria bacterium]|nr:lamin tail domain-containing protein [Candidatus Magasanikbacteria bacterium]